MKLLPKIGLYISTKKAKEIAEAYLEKVGALKGNLLPAKGLLKKFIKELESKG